ncbi:hypothetical protein [Krasilnikovia sp. M28-CT-15]|uniref:hypothetical protein n=1 Tax=Krasilnikovia sp. M28-CT-15 TaxID=3373540 RepID=UPI00399C684F
MSDEAVARGRELVWHLGEAACVTFAKGDADTVISAFGGDPAHVSVMTIEESEAALSGYHYSAVPKTVLVRGVGDWQVAVEPNGFEGSRIEVLRPFCARGPALSVFWGLNGSQFSYAVGGRTAVGFAITEPARVAAWARGQRVLELVVDLSRCLRCTLRSSRPQDAAFY